MQIFTDCDEIISVALMKGDKSSDGYKRHLRMEENSAAGLLNFVVALSIAAVAYADWMRVGLIHEWRMVRRSFYHYLSSLRQEKPRESGCSCDQLVWRCREPYPREQA